MNPRTGHHTGRRRPSQISDGRPPIGPVASGRYPAGPTPYVPGSRPGIVSTRGRFQRAESRSARLSLGVRRSQSGTGPERDDWQALAGLSWLSFSRPSDLPRVPDSGQRAGSACCQVGSSPRQRELNGPPWARTPRAGFSPASSTTASGDSEESLEVLLCRPDPPRPRVFLSIG